MTGMESLAALIHVSRMASLRRSPPPPGMATSCSTNSLSGQTSLTPCGRSSPNSVFPQRGLQAVRRAFAVEDDDEPMQEGILVQLVRRRLTGNAGQQIWRDVLTMLSARPRDGFRNHEERTAMASFTQ